jgi:acetyl esterase/lipase
MTDDTHTCTRDIEYAVHDGVSLKGHLWKPAGKGPHPVLITIHGGGWRVGGPDNYLQWGPKMAERGFAMFSIAYRLTLPHNKPVWPQAPCDVRAAVQFLRGNAESLGIDPGRIAMMGDSAGAHLSALIALAGNDPLFQGLYPDDPFDGVSTKVKAVIGNYGVYDMVQQWMHDQAVRGEDHIVQYFLGCAPRDNRKLYFEASPMSYVEKARNTTAFLLTHGTEDDVVDRIQTDDFHDQLKIAGFFSRKLIVQGAGHYATQEPFNAPRSYSGYLLPRVVKFLQERMG